MVINNTGTFTIEIPSGGNTTIKYETEVIDEGNNGFVWSLTDTDSLILEDSGLATVGGAKTTDTVTVITTKNLELIISARPSIVSEQLNEVSFKFTLFECDGLTLIPSSSFTLTDNDIT